MELKGTKKEILQQIKGLHVDEKHDILVVIIKHIDETKETVQ